MNTLSVLSHSITLFRCSPLAPPFPGSFVLEFIGPDMYKINGVSRTTPFSNSFFAIARTGTNVFTVTPTVFFPAGITIYGGLGVQLASASGCPMKTTNTYTVTVGAGGIILGIAQSLSVRNGGTTVMGAVSTLGSGRITIVI